MMGSECHLLSLEYDASVPGGDAYKLYRPAAAET